MNNIDVEKKNKIKKIFRVIVTPAVVVKRRRTVVVVVVGLIKYSTLDKNHFLFNDKKTNILYSTFFK